MPATARPRPASGRAPTSRRSTRCTSLSSMLRGATAAVVILTACGEAPDAPVGCQQTQATLAPEQCGPSADYTPVNSYAGDLAIVDEREDAVAMINGVCTGTLVDAAAGPVVLTAGHCVRL